MRTDFGDTASLTFDFENPHEAELFGEFVKMLFGIQVQLQRLAIITASY